MLESIRLAKALGLTPVKVNAVIIRGLNDHEIGALAHFAVQKNIVMRMIEFSAVDPAERGSANTLCPAAKFWNEFRPKSPSLPAPQHAAERHPVGLSAMARRNLESLPRSPSRSAASATASA